MEVSFGDPDQYGQQHPENENDDLIAEKLKAFNARVAEIPTADKENLVQAESKCPGLLDDAFKLQFLRCEVFNVELAAKRYIKYWDKRVEIFGPEKAFEPMTQSGALSEDKVAFEHGVARLVVDTTKDNKVTIAKDSSGRSIVFLDPSRQDKTKYSTESMVRVVWYVFHAALENEEAQRKGIIILAYPHNAKVAQFNRELAKHITSSIKGSLPVRLSAFHVCQPPTFFRVIFPILKLFLGERLRKRIRIHSGSKELVLKDLDKSGLAKTCLPTELGGDITLDHQKWLAERRAAGM